MTEGFGSVYAQEVYVEEFCLEKATLLCRMQPVVEQLSPSKCPMPGHNYYELTHLGGKQLLR